MNTCGGINLNLAREPGRIAEILFSGADGGSASFSTSAVMRSLIDAFGYSISYIDILIILQHICYMY